MRPSLLLLIGCLAMPLLGLAQSKNFDPAQTISPDSARHCITELLDEMAKKHPGYYRYTTKPAFDRYIDSSLATIHGPQNQLDLYRKLKPIIARIRCVHTGVALAEPYAIYLNKSNNLLPLDIYFINDRAYVTANYSGNNGLSKGVEILAINDRPMAEIKRVIFNNIPTDGYNETFKYQLLNNRFSQWYRSVIEVTDKFKVSIATAAGPKGLSLAGVKNEAIPLPAVMDLKNKPRLDLQFKNEQAVLTIRSFGETDIKIGGQSFKKFIANSFSEIQDKKIGKLVIDLRNNTGGTDANAALLCSYLMNKPYRYWDRIEVTEPFALSIKGSARLMYGKPIKQDSVYLWRRSKFTNEFDLIDEQQPNARAYTGKVTVLINGACLSSCADLTAILQHNGRAMFIGEETGGGYQGNNSGLIPDTKITFGITVSIPLLKYINAVDRPKNIGHGTYPDIAYSRTIYDVIQGKDPEMDIALK